MTAWLRTHKPAISQFRSPRRSRPTGLTVIHTAESVLDSVGPDTGAEKVAEFIRDRRDYGSYHDLVDADSALQLVRYEDEAYQDGTGSNPYALSISFACRTTDWARMSSRQREGFLRQGAVAFARQQAWLAANGYRTTPLRRISRGESAGGAAGFISHAERDPDRRSDPGKGFPWAEFFAACEAATGTTPEEEDMPLTPQDHKAIAAEVWGYQLADRAPGANDQPRKAGWLVEQIRRHSAIGVAQDELLVEAVRDVAAARGLDPDALSADILNALAKRLEN